MDAPSPAPPGRLRFWLIEALLVLGVLGLALKLSYDHASTRDLELADEPFYLWGAILFPRHGLRAAEMSPLYSLWYYLLSLVQSDPVELVFLNWSVLVCLVSVSLYTLTRCLGGTRLTALIVSFLILTTTIIEIRPYLMHLAIALLAFGGAAAAACRSWRWRWAILSLTFMLVGYIRPEMYVAFLLSAATGLALMGWQVARHMGPPRRFAAPLLVIAGVAALLGWRVGIPLGSRSFVAFGQHYAYKRALEQHQPSPIAAVVRYESVVAADFGHARTIGKALKKNPTAFAWHLLTNLDCARYALRTILEPRLHLPPPAIRAFQITVAAVLAVGVLGLLWQLLRSRLKSPETGGLVTGVVLLILVLIPTWAAAFVIYPREHYLMPGLCLGLALLAASLSLVPGCRRLLERLDRLPVLLAIFVILFAFVPNRAHGWDAGSSLHWAPPREPVDFQQRAIVAVMKRLPLQDPLRFLDYFAVSRPVYAGKWPDFTTGANKGDEPFWSYVRRADVTVIVLDYFLCNDPQFARDHDFQEFALGRTINAQFVRFNIPDTVAQLVVRRDALADATLTAQLAAEPEGARLLQFRAELAEKFRQLNSQAQATTAINH